MALRPIDRIVMPDTETFFREYVYKRRPAIITNLLEGDPIRELKTLDDASKAFGSAKLDIVTEYSTARDSGAEPPAETMTFDSYWEYVRANPKTMRMCTEYPTPARVSSLFKLPDVCRRDSSTDQEILGMPRRYGDFDMLTNTFIGNAGNVAHVHFDGDQRQVILYQVFGEKKVVLFEPTSAPKLKVHEWPGFSGVDLEKMGEDEQRAFISDADGWSDVIYPGEAIYMPMLIWHYFEYTTDAMSCNFRFGRNKYGRFLAIDNFHRDSYLQIFAAQLADVARSEIEFKEGLSAIIAEYTRPAASVREKVSSMRHIFRGLCKMIGAPEHDPEAEEEALDAILKDMGSTQKYVLPDPSQAARAAGPITEAQKRTIVAKVATFEYPPGVFERLIYNAVGKCDIDQLNWAEARHLIRHMTSPGAAW